MTRTPREQRLFVLSIPVTALPLLFGVARAASTGTDFRYLWTALAALVAAALVLSLERAGRGTPASLLVPWLAALIVATLVAGATGYMLGARSIPALGVVAVSFGLCCATGLALFALSQPRGS
jgi:small-conductance mechanosensitive channel